MNPRPRDFTIHEAVPIDVWLLSMWEHTPTGAAVVKEDLPGGFRLAIRPAERTEEDETQPETGGPIH